MTQSGTSSIAPLTLAPAAVPPGSRTHDRVYFAWIFACFAIGVIGTFVAIVAAARGTIPWLSFLYVPTGCGIAIVLSGWAFRALQQRVRRPAVALIHAQLASRHDGEHALNAWGSDPVRRALAEVACREIAAAMALPNARLVPDDPLDVLFFSPDNVDDGEFLSLLCVCERHLDRHLDLRQFPDLHTLGDLVDAYLSNQPGVPQMSAI